MALKKIARKPSGIKIPRNALAKGREEFRKNPNGMEDVDLPAGMYQAAIMEALTVDTKKGPQLLFRCKIGGDVEEEFLGGIKTLWFSFDEDRVVHLFRALAKLGYDVEELDEDSLLEIISDLKENNPVIQIRVNGQGFANFKSALEDMSLEDLGFDGATVADDDEEEEDEEEEDELDGMSRTELKAFIKQESLDIHVKKTMTDDALRTAIREAIEEED